MRVGTSCKPQNCRSARPLRHDRSVNDLAAKVSSTLRRNDPLDPWLTESHWDDGYWNDEAERIAERLAPGMAAAAVRQVVVEVLGGLLASSSDPIDQSHRLDLIAREIAGAIEQTP
jgi:hypothetical protein